MAPDASTLSIGELSTATGVAPGTLRMWEGRHGFPQPTRQGRGGRRYAADDADRVTRVLRERQRGLSLAAAIERVRNWSPSEPPSLFSALRDHQPQLAAHRLALPAIAAISHAMEDECLSRAAHPILAAAFQHEHVYRRAEHRWRELARSAALAFVLADFPERRTPPGGPTEVPLDPRSPIGREWAVVCVDERYTACLVGWEQPSRSGQRRFETIWSTDPDAVTATLRTATTLADPALARAANELLGHLPLGGAGDTATTLSLANRMIAYLASQ